MAGRTVIKGETARSGPTILCRDACSNALVRNDDPARKKRDSWASVEGALAFCLCFDSRSDSHLPGARVSGRGRGGSPNHDRTFVPRWLALRLPAAGDVHRRDPNNRAAMDFLVWVPLFVLGYLQWFVLVPAIVHWWRRKFG